MLVYGSLICAWGIKIQNKFKKITKEKKLYQTTNIRGWKQRKVYWIELKNKQKSKVILDIEFKWCNEEKIKFLKISKIKHFWLTNPLAFVHKLYIDI